MRNAVLATALTIAALTAGSADAASFVSGSGAISLDASDDFSWTTNFAATAGSGLVGTTGTIVFNFLSANAAGTLWNFSYSVDNTSVAPSAMSELSSFGFNTSATPSAVSTASGLFSAGISIGNFNGLGSRSICLYAGPNCNGGASNGVEVNDAPASGTFSIGFGTGTRALTLDGFVARWQSTGANGRGSASGPGSVTGAVPESATWAMMILGFGVVGWSLRRRAATRYVLRPSLV